MNATAFKVGRDKILPLIEVEGLSYAVEGKSVLTDITLRSSIRHLGVIGRNGSGKTTFVRLLAGLVAPTSGSVSIDGLNIAEDRKAALSMVGVLFQNPDHQIIFPTVIEELTFGLRQQGKSKDDSLAIARQTLTDFGKQHWEEAATHVLSQGQRHLVCLMALLAMRPKLLVLDEPFAGLDIPTRMQLSRYLSMSDASLVHITHDPADLTGYDEVLWLDEGKLRVFGPAGTVLRQYKEQMALIGGSDDISHLAG